VGLVDEAQKSGRFCAAIIAPPCVVKLGNRELVAHRRAQALATGDCSALANIRFCRDAVGALAPAAGP